MRTTRARLATAVALLVVLAPLAPAMAWHCGDQREHAAMPAGDDCSDGGMHRCAGLWSAACCEFSSPARPTRDVPGGFDLAYATPVVVGAAAASLPLPPLSPSSLDLLAEDRAGPPPPRLLTSVLLI